MHTTQGISSRSGPLAIVPLVGVFGKDIEVRALTAEVAALGEDRDVGALLVLVDSPGGQVEGVEALATCLRSVRASKPVYALIEGKGCSAAYWVASQADEVWCEPGSEVGGIGVTATLYDTSEALRLSGVQPVHFASGTQKLSGAAGSPLTKEIRDKVESNLKAVFELFREAVSQAREIDLDSIVWQGGTWIGSEAVRLGLVGRMGRLDYVAAEAATAAEIWISASFSAESSDSRTEQKGRC